MNARAEGECVHPSLPTSGQLSSRTRIGYYFVVQVRGSVMRGCRRETREPKPWKGVQGAKPPGGGTGAKPPLGVRGRNPLWGPGGEAPSEGPGGEAPGGGSGAKPPIYK